MLALTVIHVFLVYKNLPPPAIGSVGFTGAEHPGPVLFEPYGEARARVAEARTNREFASMMIVVDL